ncbi:phage holin family protein [Agromyces aerolatus]|uniref:phage holin family protein n=1 Tax=Agromyces sp. LY-1074 TaxID=3074080 RepID=UPI00285D77B9|nr:MULTISPECIES: phage holin family protein [unclassified Agromyces]MDR5701124.1 phage holin family protein [Agromyces sp. LY-1074]MDR5707764.1 phage holin family protein [Agromyces sp. LY-1358]
MVRVLIRLGIFLGSAALALALAALLVRAFHLEWAGLLVAIVVFAVVQAALDWLVRKVFDRSAPAVAGVAGLISTFLALWIASLFPGGVSFDGIGGWILAAVVVWVITALLGWLGTRYLLRPYERTHAHTPKNAR